MLAFRGHRDELGYDGFAVAACEDQSEGQSCGLAHDRGAGSEDIFESVADGLVRRGEGSEAQPETGPVHDDIVLVKGRVRRLLDYVLDRSLVGGASVEQAEPVERTSVGVVVDPIPRVGLGQEFD